mmetsp:Transcript_21664/g.42987  ORF Transcript_21664/g.42987 Transcript_21664/m.42987 type:complete len:92 (+) Transcript_21664:168-443(+)
MVCIPLGMPPNFTVPISARATFGNITAIVTISIMSCYDCSVLEFPANRWHGGCPSCAERSALILICLLATALVLVCERKKACEQCSLHCRA